MEKSSPTFPPSQNFDEEAIKEDEIAKKVKQLELSLPMENRLTGTSRYFYQNFWCPSPFLYSVISCQNRFQSQDTDILLVTKPKSGTTWLKALAFSILNRRNYPISPSKPHPLLIYNPHQLVPFIEIQTSSSIHLQDHSEVPRPRLLATHLPYNSIPESIKKSGCRIVYMCRNILDTAISLWIFVCQALEAQREQQGISKEEEESVRLEDFLDDICRGVESYGPHWEHVLGYWRVSLERPNKVLFMKYEDIKEDEKSEMKRLAEFMGCPFSLDEEESGLIEEISKLCSIQNMKELEVNKTGDYISLSGKYLLQNNMFFRKGEVGDWMNHMSLPMAERLEKIMQEKFQGSGLIFKTSKKAN